MTGRKPERRRAWLEAPGASQRVAQLVGCEVQQVADAHVEARADGVPGSILTVTVRRPISPQDTRVLLHGRIVA